MKKHILFLFSVFLLFSCEEVVDVDVDTDDPRLVIDAKILRNHAINGNSTETEVEVLLSLTTPFFETNASFVNDAEVFLTNLSNNTVYTMQNRLRGRFTIVGTEAFIVEDETEYLLTVIYNDETYEAREIINPSVPIDNLFQFKNNNVFSDDEDVAVNITFTDLEGIGSHYIFKFDDANFLASDDEFIIDGAPFNFDYFHEEPKNTTLKVDLLGSDEITNNYIDSVMELFDGGSNGPFSTVPFQIRGNIVNVTNADNFPFGFFRINEVYTMNIDLVDNEEAPEKPSN